MEISKFAGIEDLDRRLEEKVDHVYNKVRLWVCFLACMTLHLLIGYHVQFRSRRRLENSTPGCTNQVDPSILPLRSSQSMMSSQPTSLNSYGLMHLGATLHGEPILQASLR